MNTTNATKHYTLLAAILFFSVTVYGGDGLYLTYKDFKENKLTEIDQASLRLNRGKLSYKIKGAVKEVKPAEVFGVSLNDNFFRLKEGKTWLRAVVKGEFYLWCEERPCSIDSSGYYTEPAANVAVARVYYLSPGADGNAVLIENLQSLTRFAEKHPGFKPVCTCVEDGMNNSRPAHGQMHGQHSLSWWVSNCLGQMQGAEK